MVVISSEVTKEIKQIIGKFVASGIYKSQSEVVRDAVRQLAYKYGVETVSLEEVKKITAKATKKTGETLSKSVKKIREET